MVKTEPLGPEDTPWAMQAVIRPSKRDRTRVLVRVEPVHPPKQENPWEPPRRQQEEPRTERQRPAPPPQQHAPPPWEDRPDATAPPKATAGGAGPSPDKPQKQVCARNYAAVEDGLERYGLIDMGARPTGRSLLVHARKRCRPSYSLLNAVRPGTVLRARPAGGGQPATLRVRYTTPARYYSPGALVTTLAVGVDEADWQSLMAGTRRI